MGGGGWAYSAEGMSTTPAPRTQREPAQQPSRAQVRSARLAAGARVHMTDGARWRAWEREGPSGRDISPAAWELYLIKTKQIYDLDTLQPAAWTRETT